MPDPSAAQRPPTALLVSDQEWSALAIGAVISAWGYTVGRAGSIAQALQVADAIEPDVVFVDAWHRVADDTPRRLPRDLREAGAITPATPVVVFSADPLSRAERLKVLTGGAWDVVELPLDAPLLRARLDSWIAAKRYADRLEASSLRDHQAPIYNLRGLLSRARELGADAARAGAPLACVAIGAVVDGRHDDDAVARRMAESACVDRLRAAWTTGGRASDVIGRVGRTEFVVLAPRTDVAGARVLADRLRESLSSRAPQTRVQTAVHALEPTPAGADDAIALVGRAVTSLERAGGPRLLAR